MVGVAQLVRAPDCGSGGRGFETRHPPHAPSENVREVVQRIDSFAPMSRLASPPLASARSNPADTLAGLRRHHVGACLRKLLKNLLQNYYIWYISSTQLFHRRGAQDGNPCIARR